MIERRFFMDYQPKPQFVELALKESCPADCSSCPTFPAPFRRIGDSSYCRFVQQTFGPGEGVTFPADEAIRILFVMAGSIKMERDADAVRMATSNQCVCLARGTCHVITSQDAETRIVVLSLVHRIEFCEQDIFGRGSRTIRSSRRRPSRCCRCILRSDGCWRGFLPSTPCTIAPGSIR